jgi:integrase
MVGYRASVYKHLIPGFGAHRLDKLTVGASRNLYEHMVSKKGLKPTTAHLANRTVRVALNEVVRRGRIVQNPAKIAKDPRVNEDEIVPFTVEEAQRLSTAAATVRNGARFVVAPALGLRSGEALGLRWSDIAIKWNHGCPKGNTCRSRLEG